MRLFDNLSFELDFDCVAALGCFDGVHLGHRKVIGTAKEIADAKGLPLAVFTFQEPPRRYFSPESVSLLSTVSDKLSLLEELGVDICVCVPFGEQILNTEATHFVTDTVLQRMRAKHIVCGYNYSFGKRGAGNTALLARLCQAHGCELTVIPEQKKGDYSVSSSLIREAISNGNAELAENLLGRPYSISASVIDGQHLARKLGFPTVNIIPPEGIILPKRGVYVTRIKFDNIQKYGITNVGIRPTVGLTLTCAETHIFDFEGNLYGKTVRVEFLHFIRPEQKFDSVDTMAAQIYADIQTAKEHIKKK